MTNCPGLRYRLPRTGFSLATLVRLGFDGVTAARTALKILPRGSSDGPESSSSVILCEICPPNRCRQWCSGEFCRQDGTFAFLSDWPSARKVTRKDSFKELAQFTLHFSQRRDEFCIVNVITWLIYIGNYCTAFASSVDVDVIEYNVPRAYQKYSLNAAKSIRNLKYERKW